MTSVVNNKCIFAGGSTTGLSSNVDSSLIDVYWFDSTSRTIMKSSQTALVPFPKGSASPLIESSLVVYF